MKKSNDFDGKRKIESALSKRTVKRMVRQYRKIELADILDERQIAVSKSEFALLLENERKNASGVLSSVLGFISENLSEIAKITVEGKT